MEKLGRIGARCDNSQDGEKNIFDNDFAMEEKPRLRKNNGKAITIFRESWRDGVAVIAQVRMGRSSAPQLRARPLQIKS